MGSLDGKMRALGRALFPALILILPFSELAIFPPPNPPKNLRILQNTENALQIAWDLEQTGGQVRGYRVKVTPLFTYLKVRGTKVNFMNIFMVMQVMIIIT